jgi:hypothetical protein
MTNEKKCLMFPILQKFYSSLSCLAELNPDKYIFENIPKIDTFLQELRNITWITQKHFNTPELKQIYEEKRNAYLLGDNMRWFIDSRNAVTKEAPFNLEKKIVLKIYDVNDFNAFSTTLTTDRDKRLDDIASEIDTILQESYKKQPELFYSIFVSFVENGQEIDIYERIIPALISMWKFVADIQIAHPCTKCKKLNEEIKDLINKIIAVNYSMLSVQDYYSHLGKVITASRIETFGGGKDGLTIVEQPLIKLSDNPLFGKEVCNDDIKLLQKWSTMFMVIAKMQMEGEKRENPEVLPQFMLVFRDGTAEFQTMFGSSIKTTFYRKVSDISERITKEDIRAVLLVCETVQTPIKNLSPMKGHIERQSESKTTVMYSFLASESLDAIMGIGINYTNILNDEYLAQQIRTPKPMPNAFMMAPIFKAIKAKQKKV